MGPARAEHGAGRRGRLGSFCGHEQGITHVESTGDGRLVCSNGKDQCIKLWDMRRPSTAAQAVAVSREQRNFDYRREAYSPSRPSSDCVDGSVATYRGHQVFETLIRCHFSPLRTGHRYIYTGSYAREGNGGEVVVYDVMTGEVVRRLRQHRGTVRDVSWHPDRAHHGHGQLGPVGGPVGVLGRAGGHRRFWRGGQGGRGRRGRRGLLTILRGERRKRGRTRTEDDDVDIGEPSSGRSADVIAARSSSQSRSNSSTPRSRTSPR